jgi:hypothetical protein
MGDSGDTTYLGEFINSVELLPNNTRRDFELMRDLDREALELQKQLQVLEAACLDRARERKAENKFVLVPMVASIFDVHESHSQEHHAALGGIAGGSAPSDTPKGNKSPSNKFGASSPNAISGMGSPLGIAHDSTKDPEGAALLDNILVLRDRISSRLSRKTSIAINLTATIKHIQAKLNSDLAFFETTLRSCGDFEKASGAMPGTDVAIRPSQSSDEMILGKVIVYYADIGAYDVADVENSKRYHLSEELVTVLDLRDITNRRLSKGEVVYAVYPETTAFYLASVAQAPRRASAGAEPTAMVQFQGDSDDNGVTPVRTVLLKHIFRAFT